MSARKESRTKAGPLAGAKARALLRAAESSFADGLARVAGMDDPQAFKRALIDALHQSVAFEKAALALHPILREAGAPPQTAVRKGAPSRGDSQRPRQAHFDGRVQATRRDPSLGQRDRRRGYRLKGGRRTGQGSQG